MKVYFHTKHRFNRFIKVALHSQTSTRLTVAWPFNADFYFNRSSAFKKVSNSESLFPTEKHFLEFNGAIYGIYSEF